MKPCKFENVNIIETLEKVVMHNTESYQTDFRYDIEKIEKAASYSDDCRNFLWLSRKNGTECFEEKDVYIRNTHALNAWGYYANSSENVKAFAVEIDKENRIYNDGIVKGNIYELDYIAHVQEVKKNSFHAMSVQIDFKEPYYQKTFDILEYSENWSSIKQRYGRAEQIRFITDDPQALNLTIENARLSRKTLPYESANIEDYITAIVKQRFHEYGYKNDDMVFTTQADACSAVKLAVPVYALSPDNSCTKLGTATQFNEANNNDVIFGMTEHCKKLLNYLSQDPKKAISLFTNDELSAIHITAIEAGKSNDFDAATQRLIDSIIFKVETTLFGKFEADSSQEVVRESELER